MVEKKHPVTDIDYPGNIPPVISSTCLEVYAYLISNENPHKSTGPLLQEHCFTRLSNHSVHDFFAIWLVTGQKNEASALDLKRVLRLAGYNTAWSWLHKLRRTMVCSRHGQLMGGLTTTCGMCLR